MNHAEYQHLMHEAYFYALNSRDESTQNGAVIAVESHSTVTVVARGANNFLPLVVANEARLQRPDKYLFTEHAERNAILAAAKHGQSLQGATLVCPWLACADCARAIVLSGITTVVRCAEPHLNLSADRDHWDASIQAGDWMMRESGIEIKEISYDHPKFAGPLTLRAYGKEYTLRTKA